MSLSLPAPTTVTRRYIRDFLFRTAVFLMILGITLINFWGQKKWVHY